MEIKNLSPEAPIIPPAPPVPKKINLKNILIGVGIGILLTAFPALAYINRLQLQTVTPTPILPSPTSVPTPIPTNISEGGITWLKKPQSISSLNIFANPSTNSELDIYHFSEAKFFQTATFSDGSILINAFLPTDGMGSYRTLLRLVKTITGKISFIESDRSQWSYLKKIFNNDVSLYGFSIRELDPPEYLNVSYQNKNINFKKGYLREGTFDEVDNPVLIQETEFGGLYVVYFTDKTNPDIRGREFYLVLKDKTYFSYSLSLSFFSDDMKVNFSWFDGGNNKSQYLDKIQSGCGSGYFGPDTIKNGSSLLSSKEVVASYVSNDIYQIKDANSPILKNLYLSYKTGRDYPSAPPIVDYDTFVRSKNHFLYQDFLGDWLIFINQDFAPMVECGKPVIYLYPQKSTEVSVKVGADITVSEPLYPASGWTVLAHPNGTLDYQGKSYPNLFWEGKGHGPYPSINNIGFVVKQNDLIPTIKNHLKLLGLNSQESADFLEFWQPRLPKSPYVRLTWLKTNDMNRLAPLQVSPRPDTVIRIFLDFAPLDKFENLTPQVLSAPKRNGFTLIEWGGLLVK